MSAEMDKATSGRLLGRSQVEDLVIVPLFALVAALVLGAIVMAATGVDLKSLAVVWATGTRQAACVADILIRSGGFGLVLLDAGRDGQFPIAFQSRLAGLAKKHEAALICLTEKEGRQPSLGSLVSLRAEAVRGERDGDRFRCEGRILKDKRRGPGWMHVEICRGPDGLC